MSQRKSDPPQPDLRAQLRDYVTKHHNALSLITILTDEQIRTFLNTRTSQTIVYDSLLSELTDNEMNRADDSAFCGATFEHTNIGLMATLSTGERFLITVKKALPAIGPASD